MICPNCEFEYSEGNICPNCGIDVIIYAKARKTSNKLYNKGLKMARIRDLSGAASALKQSIILNKANIDARNLLGLVCFEMGFVADALKHWFISYNMQETDNPAKDYIYRLHKDGRQLEKYSDALRMYNQSLNYLKLRSDDLAIIQLRKALNNNSKLIEAYNLLAFCYILSGDKVKASSCINAVLKMDVNNLIAQKYLKEISPSASKAQYAAKKTEDSESHRQTRRKYKSYLKKKTMGYGLSVLITAVVFIGVVSPLQSKMKDRSIKELKDQVAALEEENRTGTGEAAERLKALEAENQSLKADNERYKALAEAQDKMERITQAQALMEEDSHEEAADLIADMDVSDLPEDYKAIYNLVKLNSFPVAANDIYNRGVSAYLSNNYDEAQPLLEKTLKFVSGEDFVDDAVYYLGKIAQSESDNEKAREYFNRIINDYPDSNQFQNAEIALEELGE